jgi:hypothetical protein
LSIDQLQYTELFHGLSNPSSRYARFRRFQTFEESRDAIRSFRVRSDDSDWNRSLVCGLCWRDDPLSLFINIRQLKILLGKSKSSINGAFAKLGDEKMPVTFAQDGPLLRILPYLADHIDIARQWTVRRAP